MPFPIGEFNRLRGAVNRVGNLGYLMRVFTSVTDRTAFTLISNFGAATDVLSKFRRWLTEAIVTAVPRKSGRLQNAVNASIQIHLQKIDSVKDASGWKAYVHVLVVCDFYVLGELAKYWIFVEYGNPKRKIRPRPFFGLIRALFRARVEAYTKGLPVIYEITDNLKIRGNTDGETPV